jgi:hypothetical protein
MHPRGRLNSLEAFSAELLRNHNSIATITIDQPPTYEDALENSKPLYSSRVVMSHRDLVSSNCPTNSRQHNKREKDQDGASGCSDTQSDNYNRKMQQQQENIQSSSSSQRKISYIQLDVSQLMISSSPPKYCDLHFSNYFTQPSTIGDSYKKGLNSDI